MLKFIQKALQAPPRARRFAARAWLWAPVVEGSLALLGLRRTVGWIERLPRAQLHDSARDASERLEVADAARAVGWAYRAHLLRGLCLPRALTQYLLQRREGAAVRLVVGVRQDAATAPEKMSSEPFAHAWVESLAERADGDRGAAGFEPLFVSPSGAAS